MSSKANTLPVRSQLKCSLSCLVTFFPLIKIMVVFGIWKSQPYKTILDVCGLWLCVHLSPLIHPETSWFWGYWGCGKKNLNIFQNQLSLKPKSWIDNKTETSNVSNKPTDLSVTTSYKIALVHRRSVQTMARNCHFLLVCSMVLRNTVPQMAGHFQHVDWTTVTYAKLLV